MQLTKVALLALFGLTSAVPTRRSVSDIESAVSSISGQLTTVDGDVVSFTGSFLQALPLLTAVNNLESGISSGASTITSTGTLSLADSNTILSSVTGLSAQIQQVLTDLEAKVHNVHAQYDTGLAANLSRRPPLLLPPASPASSAVLLVPCRVMPIPSSRLSKEPVSFQTRTSLRKEPLLIDMPQSTLLLPPRSPLCRLRLMRSLLPPLLTSKSCQSEVSYGRNIKNACIMSMSE